VKSYHTVQSIDGRSFVPVLKNADYADKERFLFWHFPNKWIDEDAAGINYCSAVRQGDWKLIYKMRDGSRQLYNLKDDIGEKEDLSKKYPDKTRTLAKALGDQLKNWNSPMPVDRKTERPVVIITDNQ
jgi:arylsulfatase A-like enzyme